MQSPPVGVAVAAAQEAGAYLRENEANAAIVMTKGRGDFVTGLDLAVNDLLQERISAAFPNHHFLSEELAARRSQRNQRGSSIQLTVPSMLPIAFPCSR